MEYSHRKSNSDVIWRLLIVHVSTGEERSDVIWFCDLFTCSNHIVDLQRIRFEHLRFMSIPVDNFDGTERGIEVGTEGGKVIIVLSANWHDISMETSFVAAMELRNFQRFEVFDAMIWLLCVPMAIDKNINSNYWLKTKVLFFDINNLSRLDRI